MKLIVINNRDGFHYDFWIQVLRHCSQCYEVLCNEEYGIAGKCNVARKTLIDSQVVRFREAMQDFFAEVSS